MNQFHDLDGERLSQLLITTDKEGNPLSQATRKDCHTGEGIPHLAFLAFLFGKEKNIYIQKRSNKKSLWDGYFDASVVSHVMPGENVEEAARRRGREELGIETIFKDLGGFYYFAKFGQNCENEFCHVLAGHTDQMIHPNPVEISEVKEMRLPDLLKDAEKNPALYTPWLKIALEKFDLNKVKP